MSTDHEIKMANLTHQMRHNQTDLQQFISDLDSWESDIKEKDDQLRSGAKEKREDSLPPVRNTIHKKKLKKKIKEKKVDPDKQKKKICGFDFRAWDKFDVDQAIEAIDKEEKKDTSSSEYETDEEWEVERRSHLAGKEKEKGNEFLKKGDYDKAVEAYSRGMDFDPTNAILPANRAMALLKQQKYAAAELDCTQAIALDPLYVKAYLRRATARASMDKAREAIQDYDRVLDLEPNNKLAKTELERLRKETERTEKAVTPSTLTDDGQGEVKAIYKSPEERSKVPLRRVPIEEIGIQTKVRHQPPLAEQSEQTKKITEREAKNFDNLIASSHTPDTHTNSHTRNTHSPNTHNMVVEIPAKGDSMVTREATKNDKNVSVNDAVDAKAKSTEVTVNGVQSHGSEGNQSGATKAKTIPGVPQSSFQFQTDFKLLKKNTEDFFSYFSVISPDLYPKLFGQCLDADILKLIVQSLLQHSTGTDVNVFSVLNGLTHVKRFSMTAMFLSSKDKLDVKRLMEMVAASKACSDQELSALKQKYDL